jgi:3-deoxy-7-phosphoheptulonate synthase
MKTWTPDSWQQKPCQQPIIYSNGEAVAAVLAELSSLPPLVTPLEIAALKQELAKAARGEAFLLQGGDCAESFGNCRPDVITNKLKILLQMSLVLIHGLRKPIIRVGRIAGQYAKPRSAETETINGITLPCYRGDLINKAGFTAKERIPNPKLMLQGYSYAALTLNYIRALIDGGFADLEHPEYWTLEFAKHSPLAEKYQTLGNAIGDILHFMKTISSQQPANVKRVDFYTSHEALNLYYEQALSHQHTDGKWYDLSTHFPWIGMRTANLDDAHCEFFRGINNPIAIKIGPSMTQEWLSELVNLLNPENEPGRLTLIVRLGVRHIAARLPIMIETVKATGKNVLWSCDPMHGNTEVTKEGIKTRHFDDILNELQLSFRIHKAHGGHLGGVHFELTGEDVTECIGGSSGLTEADLNRAYESLVDPRLNYEQALEMALLIAQNKEHL